MSGYTLHDQAKSTLDCRVMPRSYFCPWFWRKLDDLALSNTFQLC